MNEVAPSIPKIFAGLNERKKALEYLDFEALSRIVSLLEKARERGATIFFCGNGGSASTASHFAEDLALQCRKSKPFRTISLTTNIAQITAIANDYGYVNIFEWQLRTLFNKGDVVVGISASGESINVIRAILYASYNDGISIGLLGFDGGKMLPLCQYSILVNSHNYGIVEDIHLILVHLMTEELCQK